MLKSVSGFAQYQEEVTCGFGYELTLTTNNVIDKVAGIAGVRIKNDHIHWYIPRFIPSIQQQGMLSKQFLSKTTTELRYVNRFFNEIG